MKADLRDQIERANLRHLIDSPADLAILRDEVKMTPRDFANPAYRRAYEQILAAAMNGKAIPDEVLALLLEPARA